MKKRKHKATFVKGQTRVTSAKGPGRNTPCPCGSTRKYKHCCASVKRNLTGDLAADATTDVTIKISK